MAVTPGSRGLLQSSAPHPEDPVGRALMNVLTLGEHEHPGSVRAYGVDLAKSFDPRTPEGRLNWAALFYKGPKGEMGAVGPLTSEQQLLLQKLGNVQGGQALTEGQRAWMEQMFEEAGVPSERAQAFLDRYRHAARITNPESAIVYPSKSSAGEIDMAKVMGVPRGNPMQALRGYVDHSWPGVHAESRDYTDAKLGLGASERPDWMLPGYAAGSTRGPDLLFDPKFIGPRHDPEVDALLAGASDQSRGVLSSIISSINRRPTGPPFKTNLPPSGQN